MTLKALKNKLTFKAFYFRKFVIINILVFLLVAVSKILFPPNTYVVFLYIIILLGLVIYTKINFELHKIWAGIAGTLLIVFISRYPILYGVANNVGLFGTLSKTDALSVYYILVQALTVEIFNYIGALAVFFMLYDLYKKNDRT